MPQPVVPIRASTQSFTEIAEINHDLILFADGSAALVIATSAVNFGLLSEKEQDAIIYAYAGLINSLSFPVQIMIQTKHKDITSYLGLLAEQEKKQKNPKLVQSIHGYRLFVASMVKEKEVLDKKFYVVLPFANLELGPSPSVLFGQKGRGLPYPKEYIYERALAVLGPKRDHLVRLLSRLGIRAYQLTTEQLVRLFFGIYNPDTPPPDTAQLEQTQKDH